VAVVGPLGCRLPYHARHTHHQRQARLCQRTDCRLSDMVVALTYNHGLMDGREAVTSLFSTPTYVVMKRDITPCVCRFCVKEYVDKLFTSSKRHLLDRNGSDRNMFH